MLTWRHKQAITESIGKAEDHDCVPKAAEWFHKHADSISPTMEAAPVVALISDLSGFSTFIGANDLDMSVEAVKLVEAQRDSALWVCDAIEAEGRVSAILLKEEGDGLLLLFSGDSREEVARAALWSAAWLTHCSESLALCRYPELRKSNPTLDINDVPAARVVLGLISGQFSVGRVRQPIREDIYYLRQPLASRDILSRWLNSLYRVLAMAHRGQILVMTRSDDNHDKTGEDPDDYEFSLLKQARINKDPQLLAPFSDLSLNFYVAKGPRFTFYRLKGTPAEGSVKYLQAIELATSPQNDTEATNKLRREFRAGFRAWCAFEFREAGARQAWVDEYASNGTVLFQENIRLVLMANRVGGLDSEKNGIEWRDIGGGQICWARILGASADDYVGFLQERVIPRNTKPDRSMTFPNSSHNNSPTWDDVPAHVVLAFMKMRDKASFNNALEALSHNNTGVIRWDGVYGEWDLALVVPFGESTFVLDGQPWATIFRDADKLLCYDCQAVAGSGSSLARSF